MGLAVRLQEGHDGAAAGHGLFDRGHGTGAATAASPGDPVEPAALRPHRISPSIR
jgi:hypothetical protein